ncbi:MAG: citrate lyase holo-[Clostridia bacterium]|nr:citrate lyase holo-[acyl-carrier protein] synthase [Clostridia bacterium]
MKLSSVTLEDMLYSRERRAALQRGLLQGAGCRCLVCLTMNIPGEV